MSWDLQVPTFLATTSWNALIAVYAVSSFVCDVGNGRCEQRTSCSLQSEASRCAGGPCQGTADGTGRVAGHTGIRLEGKRQGTGKTSFATPVARGEGYTLHPLRPSPNFLHTQNGVSRVTRVHLAARSHVLRLFLLLFPQSSTRIKRLAPLRPSPKR